MMQMQMQMAMREQPPDYTWLNYTDLSDCTPEFAPPVRHGAHRGSQSVQVFAPLLFTAAPNYWLPQHWLAL